MKTINKLIQKGIDGSINRKWIDQYCETNNITFPELINKIALLIAHKFDNGELSFEKADKAINCFWGIVYLDISENPPEKNVPEPFLSIYDAFDEGEYDHGDNEDPVTKYTVQQIRIILKNA